MEKSNYCICFFQECNSFFSQKFCFFQALQACPLQPYRAVQHWNVLVWLARTNPQTPQGMYSTWPWYPPSKFYKPSSVFWVYPGVSSQLEGTWLNLNYFQLEEAAVLVWTPFKCLSSISFYGWAQPLCAGNNLWPWTHYFGHYSKLMVIDEGYNTDQPSPR